jgi:hypothetical protein
MSTTDTQVRAYLEADEPNYPAAVAALGAQALPALEALAQGTDPLLASKAVYLASLIPDPRAARVLEQAARSDHVTVRIAAAAGLPQQPDVSDDVAADLLTDSDQGVRKVAAQSGVLTPALRSLIAERASSTEDSPRSAAARAVAEDQPPALGEGGGVFGTEGPADAVASAQSGDEASGGGGDLGIGVTYSVRSGDGPEGGGTVEGESGGDVPSVTQHGGGLL